MSMIRVSKVCHTHIIRVWYACYTSIIRDTRVIRVLYAYHTQKYVKKNVSGTVMPDDFSANSSRESLWVGKGFNKNLLYCTFFLNPFPPKQAKTGPVKRSRASGWERVKLVLPCNTAKLGISLKFTVCTNLKVMFNKHNLSNMNC